MQLIDIDRIQSRVGYKDSSEPSERDQILFNEDSGILTAAPLRIRRPDLRFAPSQNEKYGLLTILAQEIKNIEAALKAGDYFKKVPSEDIKQELVKRITASPKLAKAFVPLLATADVTADDLIHAIDHIHVDRNNTKPSELEAIVDCVFEGLRTVIGQAEGTENEAWASRVLSDLNETKIEKIEQKKREAVVDHLFNGSFGVYRYIYEAYSPRLRAYRSISAGTAGHAESMIVKPMMDHGITLEEMLYALLRKKRDASIPIGLDEIRMYLNGLKSSLELMKERADKALQDWAEEKIKEFEQNKTALMDICTYPIERAAQELARTVGYQEEIHGHEIESGLSTAKWLVEERLDIDDGDPSLSSRESVKDYAKTFGIDLEVDFKESADPIQVDGKRLHPVPENHLFQRIANALADRWGMERMPIYVCEGKDKQAFAYKLGDSKYSKFAVISEGIANLTYDEILFAIGHELAEHYYNRPDNEADDLDFYTSEIALMIKAGKRAAEFRSDWKIARTVGVDGGLALLWRLHRAENMTWEDIKRESPIPVGGNLKIHRPSKEEQTIINLIRTHPEHAARIGRLESERFNTGFMDWDDLFPELNR